MERRLEDGYRTAEVCDAILRSSKSGRREAVLSRANKLKRLGSASDQNDALPQIRSADRSRVRAPEASSYRTLDKNDFVRSC